VTNFKYLEKTVANQNCKYEEIKHSMNSWKPRYHSVQNILLSHLPKIRR